MRIVVRDLTGVDLDYWVAKCMRYEVNRSAHGVRACLYPNVDDIQNGWRLYRPTGNWEHCGPLLETGAIYELEIDEWDEEDDGPYPGEPYARAKYNWLDKMGLFRQSGPLKTAICRAFVASKKGWSFEDNE